MNKTEMLEKSINKIGEYLRFGSKPGLERVSDLLNRLGNPHKALKVIHVGGTNGKGSVCRYVYSVLQRAGYRTGLFVSPYIEEFTERIEYDGKQIGAEDLWRHVQKVTAKAEEMVGEGLESPTEFEVLTAVMFSYFEEKNPDFVILEVGLGGRGDSTNVIEKPLAVGITSISYDHMNVLGNTLEEIAWEKAGIIKKDCPLIFASENPGVISVITETADGLNAPWVNTFSLDVKSGMSESSNVFSVEIGGRKFEDIRTGMPGRHQIMNAVCALCLLEAAGIKVSDDIIRKGISEAKQPGRIEVFVPGTDGRRLTAVVDGSHNEDSVKALVEWVHDTFGEDDEILIVTGILADKEKIKIADLLCTISDDFIITEPDNPRRLPAAEYAEVIRNSGGESINITLSESPVEACRTALTECDKNDRISVLIFTGSLYMMGDIRRTLREAGWHPAESGPR